MKLKAQDSFQTVEAPNDLDKVLSLTIDDALTIALDHSINQELDPIWYAKLSEKLGETEVQALTSGLVDQGIKIMSSKQKHVFARAKNHVLTKLKNHFINLANKQGCVYEDDYHSACYNLTDNYVLGEINTWLISAGLPLKKNRPKFETDYKKKVKDVAKHPNINKLKKGAKKEKEEKPALKKKFPDKMPDSDLVNKSDYPPLSHLNKVINELTDKEFKTEFLPPWGKKEAQADDWATNEAETWLLNDEGLYHRAIELGKTSGDVSTLAIELEFLFTTYEVMEPEDVAQINWRALASNVLGWEEVTEELEEEAAVGQEINMYDDGHFPIGGKKEAQKYEEDDTYSIEVFDTINLDTEGLPQEVTRWRANSKSEGEEAFNKFMEQYGEERLSTSWGEEEGDPRYIVQLVHSKTDMVLRDNGGSGGTIRILETDEIEEEACLEPGRKERSKGKGIGLGKGKGKGPLGVPIKDKVPSRKAQQEVPFGESDIDEFFESGIEFEQAPKTEQVNEGDIVSFQRFQELQAKQAQGMLTADEEVELAALTEELGTMMPALAKAYKQAQKEKKIFVIDKTKQEEPQEEPLEESPEDKKKKWVQDILKRKEQEDLEMLKTQKESQKSMTVAEWGNKLDELRLAHLKAELEHDTEKMKELESLINDIEDYLTEQAKKTRQRKKEAQMSSGQGLEAEKQKLESQINSQFATSVESQQWLQAVHDAQDWPTLAQIWTQLFGGYMEQPQQMEQRWPDAESEEYGFVELQNSRTKDPVEAAIQKVAQKEFHSATTKKKVQFENASFMTHIAQTEVQKAAGLEAFDVLQPNEGMLFPFDKPSHVTFHMGSVKFPIDILFLMEEPTALKVAKIIHNAQPGAVEYWSCANTSYVLEIVGGTAKKNEIKIDSECFVKDRILPKG